MAGKGDLVHYTRLFKQGPLKPADKKDLKDKINAIIDAASGSIAVEAMVEALPTDKEKYKK